MRGLSPGTLLGLARGRAPGQVVLQYTDHCNAGCPQCGMRRSADFSRSTLGIEPAKRVIDRAALAGVQALSFTGGEPLLFLDDIVELLLHAGRCGIPYLRTGSNGFLFGNPDAPDFRGRVAALAAKLAGTGIYTFWISIDSADPATHEAMRGFPGVIRGIEKALPILHAHGIYPAANLGLNRNMGRQRLESEASFEQCRRACREFYEFVAGLGFTIANACYPMSVQGDGDLAAVYAASAAEDLVRFTPDERRTLFRALSATIPEFRDRLRIFTPRCSLHALAEDAGSYPCRGGLDFFFVDAAKGEIYPCGFRGGDRLAGFSGADVKGAALAAECRRCDWECFRDPSELLGPFMSLRSPGRLLGRLLRDPVFFRLWQEDIRYYRACGYFNGRQAPDYRRIKPFFRPS